MNEEYYEDEDPCAYCDWRCLENENCPPHHSEEQSYDWNNFKVKTKPYLHQVKAYEKVYGLPFFALFMEQGTGKSKTYIDIASNLYLEGKIDAVMLIAPKGVHEQWADEQIPMHSPVPFKTITWGSKGGRLFQRILDEFITLPLEKPALKWFCVNVEAFSSNRHILQFIEYLINNKVAVCVDESTRIKNPKAQRTINIMYNLKKIKKRGKKVISVEERAMYRSILTGTMVTNSPYDLWSMFESLVHDFFKKNFYAFKSRYGIELRDSTGEDESERSFTRKFRDSDFKSIRKYYDDGKDIELIANIMSTTESNVKYIVDHPDLHVPYKHLDEIKLAIDPVAYIVRKEDCLDLPPKVYERLYVEMGSEQKRIYKELIKEYMSEYMGKELTVQNKLTLVGRLQQITGGFFPYSEEGKGKIQRIGATNPKIEILKRDMEEFDWGSPIIIWARFVGELKLLELELKKQYPEKNIQLYYGGVNGLKRKYIIEDFKAGKVDIFIANKTASTGLNLQRSHFQYFYSNSYSLEDRVQQEDRSHRIGQNDSVLYKDIIMKDTVDERVFSVLSAKKDLLDYFRSNTIEEFLGGKNE